MVLPREQELGLVKANAGAFDLDDRAVDHKPDVVCVAAPLVPTDDEES